VVNFTMRPKMNRAVLPLHGVLLQVGGPGTGKSSLARGLANRTAEAFKGENVRLLEVEAHGLGGGISETRTSISVVSDRICAEGKNYSDVV